MDAYKVIVMALCDYRHGGLRNKKRRNACAD